MSLSNSSSIVPTPFNYISLSYSDIGKHDLISKTRETSYFSIYTFLFRKSTLKVLSFFKSIQPSKFHKINQMIERFYHGSWDV